MLPALWVAKTGLSAQDTNLTTISNNLANVSTTGFKRDRAEFADLAQGIARAGRWDDTFMDVLDNPPRPKRFGGAIGHVLTHNMHHRAQIMFMMEQLGLRDHIEGDLLTWENQVYWPSLAKEKP